MDIVNSSRGLETWFVVVVILIAAGERYAMARALTEERSKTRGKGDKMLEIWEL
jgi:hypothetical protein